MFARQIWIMGSDFHSIYNLKDLKVSNKATGITIGDHVWVNSRCMILKNTTIGANSILAACALVSKNIPENCVAAGIPAKVIKKNINWDRKRP